MIKKKRKTYLKIGGICFLILMMGGFLYFKIYLQNKFRGANLKVKKKETPAFDFSFQDLKGRKYHLSDFKGKVIVLNFRFSRCPACDYELDFLTQLYSKIKNNDLIKLILLFENESQEIVSEYMRRRNIDIPVYLDSYGISAFKYGIYAYPTSFIINKDFNIISAYIGAQDWSSEKVALYLNQLANE